MDIEQDKIITLGKHHAIVRTRSPENEKYIYNVIEYPISEFQDEGSYMVISNAYSFIDALMGAVEVLGFYAIEYSKILREARDVIEKFDRGNEIEYKNIIRIDKEFCIKEMEIPRDQMEEMGDRSWNVVSRQQNEFYIGSQ